MRLRPFLIAAAASAVFLLALATAALAATSLVTIADFQFTPRVVTVHVGDTVRWTNAGPSLHTSTADNGMWNSGTLSPGQSFATTFLSAGSFAYHCSIHPNMTGTVVVQAAAAARQPATLPNTSTEVSIAAPLAALAALGLGALALSLARRRAG